MTKLGQNLVDQWFKQEPSKLTAGEIIQYTLPIALTYRLNTSAPSMATYLSIYNTYGNRGELRVLQSLNVTSWFNMLVLGIV